MIDRYTANGDCHLGSADTIEGAQLLLDKLYPHGEGYIFDTRLHCRVYSRRMVENYRREDEEYRGFSAKHFWLQPWSIDYYLSVMPWDDGFAWARSQGGFENIDWYTVYVHDEAEC